MVAKSKKYRAQAAVPIKCELVFKVGKETPTWYSIEDTAAASTASAKGSKEKYDKETCELAYRTECDHYEKLHQQDQTSDYQWLQTSLSTTAKVIRLTTRPLPSPRPLSRIALLPWSH